MDMNIVTYPAIILITYVFIEFLKNNTLTTDKDRKNIPPIAAVFGGLLGIIIFLVDKNIMGASNIVEACVTGMYSGLAAVGCNQVYKQFIK